MINEVDRDPLLLAIEGGHAKCVGLLIGNNHPIKEQHWKSAHESSRSSRVYAQLKASVDPTKPYKV